MLTSSIEEDLQIVDSSDEESSSDNSDSGNNEGDVAIQKRSRLPDVRKSSFNENNYDSLPNQRNERIEVKFVAENAGESIIWINEEVIRVGRRNSASVRTNIPGPKPKGTET